jgi:hypothetical protein
MLTIQKMMAQAMATLAQPRPPRRQVEGGLGIGGILAAAGEVAMVILPLG